jgi:hypothetical protein
VAHLGDFALETTIHTKFCTVTSTGAPTTLTGGVVDIYEDNDTTEITGAETLTLDFDSRTGMHHLAIAATAANGFEAGHFYQAVITTGTVSGVSAVGYVVAEFSIQATAALRPTTAGRTLDVTATGCAGIDWANVEGQGTSVDLSATAIDLCDDVTTTATATAVTTVNGLAANVITATSIQADAITAAKIADAAIDAATFAAGAIDAAAIADGAIDAATFAASAITSTVLATDCITSDELAASAVTEITDDIMAETLTEPAQAIPPTTGVATFKEGMSYQYFALTNKVDVDSPSAFKEFYDRAGTTVQWKKSIALASSVYTEGTGASGP